MTEFEWRNGPKAHHGIEPFVKLADVMPSRFVLAYDDNLEVAFLALDAERLGSIVNDGACKDVGDNTLAHHVSAMRTFLAAEHS